MPKFRFSYFAVTLLIFGLLFLTTANDSQSQDSISLGCCKTVSGTPTCVGCGDGGLKCAIDGSLCVETNFFELDIVCAESSIAGEAICQDAQTNGCCVISQGDCADDVSFDSCQGQHWFEVASCSAVPMCAQPEQQSSSHLDRNILIIVILIVILALIMYRVRKPRA